MKKLIFTAHLGILTRACLLRRYLKKALLYIIYGKAALNLSLVSNARFFRGTPKKAFNVLLG